MSKNFPYHPLEQAIEYATQVKEEGIEWLSECDFDWRWREELGDELIRMGGETEENCVRMIEHLEHTLSKLIILRKLADELSHYSFNAFENLKEAINEVEVEIDAFTELKEEIEEGA